MANYEVGTFYDNVRDVSVFLHTIFIGPPTRLFPYRRFGLHLFSFSFKDFFIFRYSSLPSKFCQGNYGQLKFQNGLSVLKITNVYESLHLILNLNRLWPAPTSMICTNLISLWYQGPIVSCVADESRERNGVEYFFIFFTARITYVWRINIDMGNGK